MSIDYTRGDSPAYDGHRETWTSQREEELQARIDELETQLAKRDRQSETAEFDCGWCTHQNAGSPFTCLLYDEKSNTCAFEWRNAGMEGEG